MFFARASLAIISIAGLAILTACGTGPKPPASADAAQAIPSGHLHYLPMRVFHIDVVYEFKGCTKVGDDNFRIDIATTANASDMLAPDPAYPTVIPIEQSSWLTEIKTFETKLYGNATLQSVNGDFEDKTGTVIANTLTGILKIASLFATGGIPFAAKAPQPDLTPYCQKKALDAYKEAESLRASLKEQDQIEKNYQEAVDAVEEAKGKTADLKKKLDEATKGGKADEIAKAKTAYDAAVKDQKTLEAKLNSTPKSKSAEISKQIVALRSDVLTKTISFNWTPKSDRSTQSVSAALPAQIARSWITDKGFCRLPQAPSPCSNPTDSDLEKLLNFQVRAQLSPVGTPKVDQSQMVDGKFVYRQPILALLSICKKDCPSQQPDQPIDGSNLLFSKYYSMPQMGYLASLPFEAGGAFSKRALSADFSEDGVLSKVTFSAASQAERASASFANVAGQVVDFRKAQIQAQTDARKAEQQKDLDNIKHETEITKAKIELEQQRQLLKSLETTAN